MGDMALKLPIRDGAMTRDATTTQPVTFLLLKAW